MERLDCRNVLRGNTVSQKPCDRPVENRRGGPSRIPAIRPSVAAQSELLCGFDLWTVGSWEDYLSTKPGFGSGSPMIISTARPPASPSPHTSLTLNDSTYPP